MTFKTDDRQILMADGSITVQSSEKTVIFNMSEGQVLAETDDTECQNSEFILDMNTLEVKYDDKDG